jgi:hypothetical protein
MSWCFEPGPYPKGAAWEIALMSTDRSIRAFTKAIPHPILARHGDVHSLSRTGLSKGRPLHGVRQRLCSRRRSSYRIALFRAGNSKSASRSPPDGSLPSDIVSHRSARGTDRSARYMVKGGSCEVVLDYEWGEPALIRR